MQFDSQHFKLYFIVCSDDVIQIFLLRFHRADRSADGNFQLIIILQSIFDVAQNSIHLIIFQSFVSSRVADGKSDTSSSESNELNDFANTLSESKELTDDDIEKIKKAMENELTPTQLNEMTRILQKFKKGTTAKDHFEGMVSDFIRINESFAYIQKDKQNFKCFRLVLGD